MTLDEMPALGIIGCTVLTSELAYLLTRDRHANAAVIVDNSEGRKLASSLERSLACERVELVEWEQLGHHTYDPDEVVVWMNSAEMHNSHERMRNALSSEIKLMSKSVDAILLLYGQCRCQTLDMEALEEEVGVPIVCLTDRHNAIVDDCISAILGSSQRYLEAMKRFKGAFFLTPGYVDGYANKMNSQNIVELMEEIERLSLTFETLGRPPLIKLDTNIDGGAEYHALIDRFARTFDLEVHNMKCDMEVFERSYDWSRSVMRARTGDKAPIMFMVSGEVQSESFPGRDDEGDR